MRGKTMKEYCRIAFKTLALIVLVLYIKLWLTKIDDTSMAIQESDREKSQMQAYKPTLKIVTYNMWCNYLIKSDKHNAKYIERFQGFANGLKDVDIVFVQEVFIFRAGPLEFSNCATEMIDVLQSGGFNYRTNITDTIPYVFGQTSGVAIFSKIPIKTRASEIFKDAGILEYVNNKGFVSAEIVVNEKKIALFTAHTDAHKERIRLLQLKQLTSAIKRHKVSMVIVGGDLNINPFDDGRKKEYENLLNLMNNTGLKTVFPKPEKTHPIGCFDYLFVSSNVKVAEKKVINLMTSNGLMVSDHFGLSMVIDLPKI